MTNKRFIELLADVKKNDKFRLVEFITPNDGDGIVSYTGHIIGSAAKDELIELGRKHGLMLFANSVNVWESQEFFETYGPKEETNTIIDFPFGESQK